MVSIAFAPTKRQAHYIQSATPSAEKGALAARWGEQLFSIGYTAISNLLLEVYTALGITHDEMLFLIHVLSYQRTAQLPYPSIPTVAKKMGVTDRAVQGYIQRLKTLTYQSKEQKEQKEQDPPTPFLIVTARYNTQGSQLSNTYDFSGLMQAAVALAQERGIAVDRGGAKSCTGGVQNPASPSEAECGGGVQNLAPKEDESKKKDSRRRDSNLRGAPAPMPLGKGVSPADAASPLPVQNVDMRLYEAKDDEEHQKREQPQQTELTQKKPIQETKAREAFSSPIRRSGSEQTNIQRNSSTTPEKVEQVLSHIIPQEHMQKLEQQFGRRQKPASKPVTPVYIGAPLTQEDLDQRRREREQERQRALGTRPEAQPPQTSASEPGHASSSAPSTRPRSIQTTIEQFSHLLHDEPESVPQNINRTYKLFRLSNRSETEFTQVMYNAFHAAEQREHIHKRGSDGRLNKMPWFFSTLESWLGLRDQLKRGPKQQG